MTVREGYRQEVMRGVVDTLVHRFQLDHTDTTPTAVTVGIYSPSGVELVAPPGAALTITFPNEKITISFLWPATWELLEGYYAVLTIVAGGVTYTRRLHFDLVAAHFESMLSDEDLVNLYPNLASQLPSGTTTFRAYRRRAWYRIGRYLRQAGGFSGGRFLRPDAFYDVHLSWTLREFFLTISRREGDIWWRRMEILENEGREEMRLALQRCSLDLEHTGLETEQGQKSILLPAWGGGE
jgi:hypothetical protein